MENELRRIFQAKLLGSSQIPLCIPAFEGRYGEPYIFKTPHHPDYKLDQFEKMVDVGMSTAAAPTFFSAIKRDGYTLIDGEFGRTTQSWSGWSMHLLALISTDGRSES